VSEGQRLSEVFGHFNLQDRVMPRFRGKLVDSNLFVRDIGIAQCEVISVVPMINVRFTGLSGADEVLFPVSLETMNEVFEYMTYFLGQPLSSRCLTVQGRQITEAKQFFDSGRSGELIKIESDRSFPTQSPQVSDSFFATWTGPGAMHSTAARESNRSPRRHRDDYSDDEELNPMPLDRLTRSADREKSVDGRQSRLSVKLPRRTVTYEFQYCGPEGDDRIQIDLDESVTVGKAESRSE
jgi:hypothetical protein